MLLLYIIHYAVFISNFIILLGYSIHPFQHSDLRYTHSLFRFPIHCPKIRNTQYCQALLPFYKIDLSILLASYCRTKHSTLPFTLCNFSRSLPRNHNSYENMFLMSPLRHNIDIIRTDRLQWTL